MPRANDNQPPRFGRRQLLLAAGGAGAGALWALAEGSGAASAQRSSAAATCLLTPEVTEGPYYIVNGITRRDIRDGQKGLPLELRLTVENAERCTPLAGANVELWHANAVGVYSGYGSTGVSGAGASGAQPPSGGAGGGHATPDDSLRFLRGHQVSDAQGRVVFDTIYPGWYRGRAPHIHVKVHLGGSTVHTGQLFFNDALSDAVFRSADYSAHGQPDTTDAEDGVYQQEGGTSAILRIEKRTGAAGYLGSITMGVKP